MKIKNKFWGSYILISFGIICFATGVANLSNAIANGASYEYMGTGTFCLLGGIAYINIKKRRLNLIQDNKFNILFYELTPIIGIVALATGGFDSEDFKRNIAEKPISILFALLVIISYFIMFFLKNKIQIKKQL